MSAVETEARPDLRCPRCQAAVAQEQDWCLECGKALRRHVVGRAAGPRALAALPLLGAAVVGAALALLLASLLGGSGDGREGTASRPPAPSQSTGAQPGPAQPAQPAPTPAPNSPAARRAVGAPLWPADVEAYTVVLMSSPSPTDAAARARALARNGADAGVLLSDDYENLRPGQWVVWRGRYQQRAKAEEALRLIERAGRDGYITFVRRRS